MNNKRILLVEDDLDLGAMLKRYLNMNGFTVSWGKHGEEGLSLFKNEDFNICIIDIMMPIMDGFTLAEKIIDINPTMPFLFLTARKTKEDKLKGLKLGADDYVVKPFDSEELIFRIKNIIKRAEQIQEKDWEYPVNELIRIGNYQCDFKKLELTIDSNSQKLTAMEAKLLFYLFENKNQLIPRDEILSKIWGKTDFFSGRSMDVFISRLRKYLSKDPNIEISSIRGIGLEFNIH